MTTNLTLSVDDELLQKARKRASDMGTSVNQLVRDYLKTVAGETDREALIAEFRRTSGKGNSDGWIWNREELYEERESRYGKS